MGKEHKKHAILSASSESESRSKSRSRSRRKDKRSHKENRNKDRRERNRKRSESGSPRRRRWKSRGRSGSRSKSKDRRRSRDRDRRRHRDDRKHDRHEEKDERIEQNGQNAQVEPEKPEEPKISPERPNFTPSGILATFTNTVNGVVLKFTEPPEAAEPTDKWTIYPFKGEEALPALHLHRQSCFLIGKDRTVADIPVDHPTISSQHAVIQFREIKKVVGEERELVKEIKPYLMDLESRNGTFLNGEKIEPAKYYELLNKDVIKLANSSRDYVVMKGD